MPSTATARASRGLRPWRALRAGAAGAASALPATAWLALLGVAASALVAVGLGLFINAEVRDRLLAAEARGLESAVNTLSAELPDLDLLPLSPEDIERLDKLVDRAILDADHVRAKLWAMDGLMIYSDAHELIGRRFTDVLPSLAEAARTGVLFEVTDLDNPENALEREYSSLVEFYLPIKDASGRTTAVIEIYEDVSFLEDALSRISVATWLAIGTGLTVLLTFLLTLIVSAARSITRDRATAETRAAELTVLVNASRALRSTLNPQELLVRLEEGIRDGLDLGQLRLADAAPEAPTSVGAQLRDGRWLIASGVDRRPTDNDRRVLEAVSTGLDAALANAALYADVRQAAEERRLLLRRVVEAHEDERGRIVGELHDSLASELIRILYGIRGVTAHLDAVPEDVARELALLDRLAADAEQHLRGFMGRIRPIAITEGGLPMALRDAVARFRDESGLDVRLVLGDGAEGIPAELALVLLRAAEEGLLNVRKHAQAHEVHVQVLTDATRTTLTIDDDGVGWPAGAIGDSGRGLGLAYLRERVAGFHGDLRTESSPLGGARLVVHVPAGAGS